MVTRPCSTRGRPALAWNAIAAQVPDPEMPMLTLADLGVLRGRRDRPGRQRHREPDTRPTPAARPWPRCAPKWRTRLRAAGFADVEIRTVLDPPWSTDWITPEGRRKLAEHGIAPPGPAPRGPDQTHPGIADPPLAGACPRCGSAGHRGDLAVRRHLLHGPAPLPACREPFEHVKEI
jgi:ring-1,2-phenylacetyl-CoA epoxidase subunit PaaD